MTLPTNRLDGYKWLIKEKSLQLVKLGRSSKVPVRSEKAWTSAPERSFSEMGFGRNNNAGVRTGRISGVIVLDIDDAVLFPKEYDVPETFTVKTSKGFHHYFQLPNDGKIYGSRSIGSSGFDIRCEGGQVVAPWSTHPDGTQYAITVDSDVAPAPQWLLDLSETTAPASSSKKMPTAPPIVSVSAPSGFKFPPVNKEIIKEPTAKGKRSDKIWQVINELVEVGCSDDEIVYVFESHRNGIGEKYYEKGAGRVAWIEPQIAKARKVYADRYADPVEAKNQGSVKKLTEEIVESIEKYGNSVSPAQMDSIKSFANLLFAMYEGSVTGWYAIPIPVGGGKTQSILHFIKFLYENDKKIEFPISVAFEKISEIEEAAKWLEDNGVPNSFFQTAHHEVPDFTDVLKKLPGIPVILHTHQKLCGASYLTDYFSYHRDIRKLLIYDESMLNAMIHSATCRELSATLATIVREYRVDEDFQDSFPTELIDFFSDLNTLIEKQEKNLLKGMKREVPIEPDVSYLAGFDYADLVMYSRILESKFGESDLFRDLLLTASAPKNLRTMSLVRESTGPAMMVTKELLDSKIENLITTDASREFRRLFKYTSRADGKKVRIYKVPNFRWDDELGVRCIPLNSGRESIGKAFEDNPTSNQYLEEITKIVKQHNDYYNQDKSYGKAEKAKYLLFYPKTIKTIPPLVQLKLIKEDLIAVDEVDDRLNFETFGRETATNKYADCEVIVFVGLNHKPQHAIDALIAGERFTGDAGSIKGDVEIGELLQQLQQGIGRGKLRKGKRQFVYFFDPKPERFGHDIQKAFVMSYYNGKEPGYYEDPFESGIPSGAKVTKIEPGW